MLRTLLLTLSLAGPVSAAAGADTTKAPPRPAPHPTSPPAPSAKSAKPAKPAKPVGEPVLKRRHPGY